MQITKGKKTALIFGATGLVGKQCLRQLLASELYKKVVVFGRSSVGLNHENLVEHLIDFDELNKHAHLIKGDDIFCCLGTTMKKAGSKKAFKKVDHDYVVKIAEIASTNKVNQFLLISSVGADEDSIFYYSEIKGLTEKAIKKIDFWGIHIFQPSLLLGDREEFRLAESIAMTISKGVDNLIGNWLGQYKPVEDKEVAKAMIRAAQKLDGGIYIYPSDHIQNMAERFDLIVNKNASN